MAPKMSRRQAGLTMIEVAIASVILAAIVAMSSWLVWQASDHVRTAEVSLQMEVQAREFIETFSKELRQSKMTTFKKLDPATIIVSASTLLATAPPGNVDILSVPNPPLSAPTPPASNYVPFSAVRFKLPGSSMDLTTLNAKNFDMKKFQTDVDAAAWTYEVQYWWEVEYAESKAGSGPNSRVPDGIDNNWNGIVDEGVIKKIESEYDSTGVLKKRTESVVCRDVKYDSAANMGCFKVSVPSTDPKGTAYPSNAPKVVNVSLTLQKRDPRYPKDSKRVIEKTVTASIEVRN